MLLELTALTKTYDHGEQRVEALRGVSLGIERGEFVAVMGPSGSGKSTLLHLIGGLDEPSSGSVQIEGESLAGQSDSKLARFRRRKLGFVFQSFHLLPMLTAEENVSLPLLLDGERASRVAPKARALLGRMGLAERAQHRPHQLSGGEMQRVAIARALVADPMLVLADEPTGNLDTRAGVAVLELLRDLARERRQAIVMVTHDPAAARFSDRLIALRDGVVEADGLPDDVLSRGQARA